MTSATPKRSYGARIAVVMAVCIGMFTTGGRSASFAHQSSASRGSDPPAVLRVLDDAVRDLGGPSADYRQVVTAAMSALETKAGSAVRAELGAFLARVPEPGAKFRCNSEFLRRRTRKTLLHLRERLAGENPRPVEPEVCYATPAALDPGWVLTSGGTIDIYGFDLDEVPIQLDVVNADGFVDITTALRRVSHHHLVVDVRPGAVPLSAASRSLAVVWGHVIRYSVPIVHDTTRLCPSTVETIPRGTMVTYARSANATAFSGEVSVDVSLEYSSNKLEALICVVAAGTSISGCTTAFLYTTDADSEIEGLLGTAGIRSRVRASGRDDAALKKPPKSGPVRQWFFPGDPRRGPDLDDASIAAQLDEIQLVSAKDDACVSPITYLEARRSTTFDPRTRRALDRQLQNVDSRISKLRPQFAPPR